MMTRKDVLEHAEALHQRTLRTMQGKNHDYGSKTDPFANFRGSEFLDIDPRTGILIRIMDKISRLRTHIQQGKLMVPGETAIDALSDIDGYVKLFYCMEIERGALIDERKDIDYGQRPEHTTLANPMPMVANYNYTDGK
jgi:hypothetical protein